MPKIVDYAKTKKQIIRNAFHVFVEKGYYKTKLSDIAQLSHMKRTSFYSYFKNKDAVFEKTILYLIDTLVEILQNCSNSPSVLSVEEAKKIHQSIEERLGFNNLFRLFMEFWLMMARGEFTLSQESQEKIKAYTSRVSPYHKGLQDMMAAGSLSQMESLHYSILVSLPEKFLRLDQETNEPLMPFLTLYD